MQIRVFLTKPSIMECLSYRCEEEDKQSNEED